MKGLKTIFISPYILSLIPFFIIIILVPFKFSKYILETESTIVLSKNTFTWYNDLDNDGSSEKLFAFDLNNSTGISISNANGILDQWNFKGNFGFASKKCLFIAGDKDNDGKKEIYVFTLLGDTILLNCISDLRSSSLLIKNRIIAITGKGIKNPDPYIIPAEMEDLDGDGIKELIFGIGSGFSKYPRNVFAYFISKDSLLISPESSFFIQNILQDDINGDGKREIIPYGYSAANISPEKAKYHDYSSFLIVLNQNLKFQFDPLEFMGIYSGLTPFIKKTVNGNSLAVLFNPSSEKANSTIYYINNEGFITDSVPLPFYAVSCLNTTNRKIDDEYLISIPKIGIALLNSNLVQSKLIPFNSHPTIIQKDFDLDSINEILVSDSESGKLFIYRKGLVQPVSINLQLSGNSENYISLKISDKADPVISIQSDQNLYLLKYGLNPSYPYYYAYFIGIYLSILCFALIIRNIQSNQIKKKYDTEKKISELQLALIRNQLDPHFILNAINSIIYSVNNSDKEQASDRLRSFAGLYRNQLLSADSSRRSLGEEIEFCNDYLMLEKMRFGERFDYRINQTEEVNNKILIPKMLVQIHAENAIKHGLSHLKSGGLLEINLTNIENTLLIEIVDNGIGREKAAGQVKQSTGKGLQIMEELYSIYNKYYNEKVSSQIIDLYDINGQPAGTKVIIRINNQNEKS